METLWPGGLHSSTRMGLLTIGGVSMHTPAWNVLDVLQLYIHSAARGANILIPGLAGRLARPRRVDEGRYSLPMVITGVVDRNGNAYANRWEGLEANIEYLRAQVITPPLAPIATRAASLLMPSGELREADVQADVIVLSNPKTSAAVVEALLELIVPAGRFSVAGGGGGPPPAPGAIFLVSTGGDTFVISPGGDNFLVGG